MTIALLSDVHDNIWNLASAIDSEELRSADRMFFLGDFCAPFTLAQIAEGFAGPIDVVFGNNDGDQFLLAKVASGHPHVTIHGQFGIVTVGRRRVALTHYPEIAAEVAAGGAFDAVFYGHDHRRFRGLNGDTLLANPGEVMGRFGEPGFALYDPDESTLRHIDLAVRS